MGTHGSGAGPVDGAVGHGHRQLAYPVAETLVKAAILLHLIEPLDKGISNMSPVGWFNFAAA
ncbi:hypothetical protein GCM10009789_82330 [Kribbella sancticallisti]|uniref:Uncharacterized protein n=1 Tax=Kribbella sancticallisti TaxID=460087 RepID=A0ABN2ESR8_9ACTN